MPEPTLRLFLALWPDAAARDAIAEWLSRWHWPAGAKAVPPERLHLTLHFLGQVAAHRVEAAAERLDVPMAPVTLRLGALQTWKDGLIVAVPDAVPPGLRALHGALADALDEADLPREDRPYRPHLTLARRATGAVPPPDPLDVTWTCDRYALVLSERGYRPLRWYPR